MAGVLATDIGDRHTALFYLSHIHTLTLAIASLSLVPIMPWQYKPLNEGKVAEQEVTELAQAEGQNPLSWSSQLGE